MIIKNKNRITGYIMKNIWKEVKAICDNQEITGICGTHNRIIGIKAGNVFYRANLITSINTK